MKKTSTRLVSILIFVSLFYLPGICSAADHAEGQIIAALYGNKNIDDVIARHQQDANISTGLRAVRPLSKLMNIWLLEMLPSMDENKMLKSIRGDADVSAAQLNYFFQPRNVPNDPLFTNEWDWNNTGQGGGLIGADVDAEAAWDITTGGLTALGDTIVVAVVDCGFYLPHADLDFWKNYGEIPNNNIDDDNNGYVDDYDGWSGNGDGTIINCSHGTHVSGTIGARGNNSLGVAGVNWNVKVMPLYYGNGDDAGAVECYSYVFAMRKLYNMTNGTQGAFIVSTNSSFGVDYGLPADHPLWCALYDSLGSVGILSAGAGPNLNIDIDAMGDIPTTCPSDWLIAVTNTTRNDLRNSGAGFGAVNMDIGAPGTGIWSTIPNDQYSGSYTGTSMATPHVAGAVALMWAGACSEMITEYKNDPAGMASVMKTIMLDNVDTLTSLNGITVSGGRLNLYKSLVGVQNYCAALGVTDHATNQASALSFVYPNPFHNDFTVYYSHFTVGKKIELKLFDVMGKEMLIETMTHSPFILHTSELSSGIYFLRIESEGETIIKKLVKD